MNKIEEFILKVQKAVCKVKREVENEFLNSKYADLEDVLDLLNPHFTENGVLVDQSPEFLYNAWILVTKFTIETDSKIWHFPLLGYDSKTPMQSLGSAVTYARRYQLKGIFKLVDSDDDANTVTPSGEPSKAARKSEVDKMLRAFAALNASKSDVETICQQDAERFTLQDMELLKGAYTALKSGKKKLQDLIVRDGVTPWQD